MSSCRAYYRWHVVSDHLIKSGDTNEKGMWLQTIISNSSKTAETRGRISISSTVYFREGRETWSQASVRSKTQHKTTKLHMHYLTPLLERMQLWRKSYSKRMKWNPRAFIISIFPVAQTGTHTASRYFFQFVQFKAVFHPFEKGLPSSLYSKENCK